MSSMLLIPDATAEQREVLRQALADAEYYRDPPPECPACPTPDQLCEQCAAGLARARAYLALSRAFGLDSPSPISRGRTGGGVGGYDDGMHRLFPITPPPRA
jgi:hypothetical protein